LAAPSYKTGTTSIQSILPSRRRALAAQGFHVLFAGQGTDGAHHRLVFALTGDEPSRSTIALLRAELAQAGPRAVLVSSEAVKEAVVNGRGAAIIDGLRRAGAGHIRLLLYLRSPFGLASSSYSSKTSRLELAGTTFAEFVRGFDAGPAFRYDHFLDLARDRDVELVVRPYDAAARRGILDDFARTLGVALDVPTEPRRNASFGPVGLEAMRIVAAEAGPLPRPMRMRLWGPLRKIAGALEEQPFCGVDAAMEAALATADRRTEAFAQAVWGRSWREVIGEERRPLNVFDPADGEQQARLDAVLSAMRAVSARLLG